MKKKLFSLLALAAFIFAGTGMLYTSTIEAASAKIVQVGYNASGSLYNVRVDPWGTSYLNNDAGEVIYGNTLKVVVETDFPVNQQMSFLGASSGSTFNQKPGVTVRNDRNYRSGVKYYSEYTVSPMNLAMNTSIPGWCLRFSTFYNGQTIQAEMSNLTFYGAK